MAEFHGNQHTENEYDSYGYDDLIRDVRMLANELEKTPTTSDAVDDERLPCLRRIYDLVDSWQSVLEDADVGQTQVESYPEDERAEMIADLREANRISAGDRLTTREYDEYGAYTTSVVKDFFGSWTDACEAADIRAGRKHGASCTGPNGERLDSRHEKEVAEFLDSEEWSVEVHPPVPSTDWIADFRVEELDLWIEVDGYREDERPNQAAFDEKISHYEQNDMRYAVVSSSAEVARVVSEFGGG